MDKTTKDLKRLHDDIEKKNEKKELTEEECISLLRTGGGAES